MTLRVCDGVAITGVDPEASKCGAPWAGAIGVEVGGVAVGVVVLAGVSVSVMLCGGELAATVAGWVVVAGGVVTTGVVESSVVEGGGAPGSDVSVDPSDEPAGAQVVPPVALAAVGSPELVAEQSSVVPGSLDAPVDDPSLLDPSPEVVVPGSDPVPVALVPVPAGSVAVGSVAVGSVAVGSEAVVSVPLESLLVVSVDPVVLPLVESLVVAGTVVPSSARATCVTKRAGVSATATTTVIRAANLRP